MRKIIFSVVSFIFALLLTHNSPAQRVPPRVAAIQEARDRQAEQQRKANNSVLERAARYPRTLNLGMKGSDAEEAEKRRVIKEINDRVSAPSVYYNRHSAFLKNKDTGLARIFPDQGCTSGKIVSVQELEKCGDLTEIPGAGSRYSFRLNKVPSNLPLLYILSLIGISDIHFIGGNFLVGTGTTQDIISNIGEVDLENVTLESESVKFLVNFKKVSSSKKFSVQKDILNRGVSDNGYTYSRLVPVKPQNTYILRSIAYHPESYKTFWHTDQTVAFKIVGQEADGSVVLLWKILKEKGAPGIYN